VASIVERRLIRGLAEYDLPVLVGREFEVSVLTRLLADARTGRGGALVLRGETGIGKTALLEEAAARANPLHVGRAAGVEAESEIAFSALDQALRALRLRLPQNAAPAEQASSGHRFTVALSALELLAEAAAAEPLLVLVDDAQWLDRPSADAFQFIGRRLAAEPIALVVATREPLFASGPHGLRELLLTGLDERASSQLLASTGLDVAPPVAGKLFRATDGNPLALEVASRSLTGAQLRGAEPLPPILPAAESLELAYRRRLESLSDEARRALVVAAANGTDELGVLVAAFAAGGIDPQALDEPGAGELVRIRDSSVEFSHPLARSAIYEAASAEERRAAHRALADAFVDAADSDRRVWHLALSTSGPDEEIAAALEGTARQASRRGGLGAAATALRRAAALTPRVSDRVERLAAAAQAARGAGRIDEAIALVEEGLRLTDDPRQRARLYSIHGDAEYSRRPSLATDSYLAAAELLESVDRGRAVLMLGNAAAALGPAGQYRRAHQLTERAVQLHDPHSDASAAGLAIAFSFGGRSADAAEVVASRTAAEWLEAFAEEPILLTGLGFAEIVAERFDDAQLILDTVIASARQGQALGVLSYALQIGCWLAGQTGRWLTAWANGTEAASLGEEIGVVIDAAWAEGLLCFIAAAQGREETCRELADRVNAAAPGVDSLELLNVTSTALGLLALGAGNAAAAVESFERVRQFARQHGHHQSYGDGWLPNLAEAYIRAGRRVEAEELLAGVPEWRPRDALTKGAAAEARCRGLLAEDDHFEAHFERALELHAHTRNPFDVARTELCFGERLRRARRRAEARPHLREAHLVFERLGAEPWAARAAAELDATGTTVETAGPPALAELTPHELRVASIVATGATNQEIASRLFVTQKTVEYHLHSIYRKLGLRSRAELTRLYLAEQTAAAAV
jgi:DNA-binding CsgD family transcriptional regulator